MQDVLSIIETVVPNISFELTQRIAILRELSQLNSTIGRKNLSSKLDMSERTLRTAIESMREHNLVTVTSVGIQISEYGQSVLNSIDAIILKHHRFYEMEQKLKVIFGLQYCRIVQGDLDQDEQVYSLLGNEVNSLLMEQLPCGNNVIAVTGGATLAHIGLNFTESLSRNRNLIFVPARGGVGGSYDIQSNTVGGRMSRQTKGQYVPLFIPENIEEQTSKVLLDAPSIKYAIDLSTNANCLLLSVGEASVMAKRYDIAQANKEQIIHGKAIGEAFGVFFDQEGREVMRLPRYGIQIEDLHDIPLLVTIAGGASKAEAVQAFFKLVDSHGILVCDEGIANKVLSGVSHKK